jgi:nitroimidazol reductase NimA-like FMN-containing flavoprotein (pyridoxamine 5'-phosphate oxidase superfamily)
MTDTITPTAGTPLTDRLDLEVLSADTCWELLASTPVGRVALLDAGEPAVFPVTYAVVARWIVFRSQPGTKLEAAAMGKPVAFEVDSWDATERTGWSVLVRGVAHLVDDETELAHLDGLGLEPWAAAVADGTWVRIRPEEVSGRRLGQHA